jgi:hypothetical protein
MELKIPKMNSGRYYKPVMIVNDDSRVVNKLEASLTDDARVIIYDRHMFIGGGSSSCLIILIFLVVLTENSYS